MHAAVLFRPTLTVDLNAELLIDNFAMFSSTQGLQSNAADTLEVQQIHSRQAMSQGIVLSRIEFASLKSSFDLPSEKDFRQTVYHSFYSNSIAYRVGVHS